MRPLADLRVLSLEQFGAGPFATMQLADLGADVIKIEDPAVGGDVGRAVPPYQEDGSSLFFESFNRNKRSIALDLRQAAGRAVFEDLARESDAVFSNLRGDGPAKLGLRYDDLKHVTNASSASRSRASARLGLAPRRERTTQPCRGSPAGWR